MPKTTHTLPTFSQDIIDDPVAFGERFLKMPDHKPIIFHDTQKLFLRGIKAITVACCGRQWGKSFALAVYITWFMVTHADREVFIIAPTVDQTRIIFADVSRYFREMPLKYMVDGKIKSSPFPEIHLINGSSCHGRGANNPDFIRGHHPHLVVVDEAAFVKDVVITKTILPMLTVTMKEKDSAIIMISTPFTSGEFETMYNQACEDDTGYMAHFKFTSEDNPYRDVKFLEGVKQRWGEDSLVWQTEYLANFADSDMAVFPWKDIQWAYENYPDDTAFPILSQPGHTYYQGVDLANTSDFFVSTILDGTEPSRNILVHMDRYQRRGYAYYKSTIRDNWHRYNHPKTLIDATTLAESVVEDLEDIDAEGYKFTGSSAKYEAVQELVRMLNEHRLVIPFDQTIIDELRFFTYSYTPNKTLRMEAKRGHDDIVMSLALSAKLAALPHTVGFFTSVNLEAVEQPRYAQLPHWSSPDYKDPFKAMFED